MSEAQTQTQVVARPPSEIRYVLYDPDPARRRRRRRAKRYDPEPARRRMRYATRAGGSGQVAMVDSALDGVAWGFLAKKLPIPSQNIGPIEVRDAVATVGAVVYEKFYMKRSWTNAMIASTVAYLVGRWVG